jgi:hypothetical protein
MQRVFIKKYFLFMVGCLPRKAVHNWVEKFSQGRSKVADDARPGADVAETTVKDFYAAGFGALVKRWYKCINVGGGCREINVFFPRFEYYMFYVLYPFVTYLLTLPRNEQGHEDSSRRRHHLDEVG